MTEVQWRAREHRTGGRLVAMHDRPGVEFHHTVTDSAQDLETAMRAIWSAHVRGNGWSDIFYNVVVSPNGDHAIGRPWDRASGEGNDHLTVAFLGNYEPGHDELTQAAKDAAGLLVWHAVVDLGVGDDLRCHSDRDATSCPGDGVIAWVEELRRLRDGGVAVGAVPAGLAAPIVATVYAPHGYWLIGADGGVFAFGEAAPMEGLPAFAVVPAAPIVAAHASPSYRGLVLVGADGGVFTLGDAEYHGSVPEQLN